MWVNFMKEKKNVEFVAKHVPYTQSGSRLGRPQINLDGSLSNLLMDPDIADHYEGKSHGSLNLIY